MMACHGDRCWAHGACELGEYQGVEVRMVCCDASRLE